MNTTGLKLTRELGKAVVIGGRVVVRVHKMNSRQVMLAFEAPEDVVIDREEVHLLKLKEAGGAPAPAPPHDIRAVEMGERLLGSTVPPELAAEMLRVDVSGGLAERLGRVGYLRCPTCRAWHGPRGCPDCRAKLAPKLREWARQLRAIGREARDLAAEASPDPDFTAEVMRISDSVARQAGRVGTLAATMAAGEKGGVR